MPEESLDRSHFAACVQHAAVDISPASPVDLIPLPAHLAAKVLAAPALLGVDATFVYDGDGQRVKSTIGGVTTYFVGAHYELTAGVAKKYYCEASRSEAEWTPSAGRR